MGKPNLIILNPDMTFLEKRCKTNEDKVQINKDWQPSFTPGKSVFQETSIKHWKFWRRARKLIIISDGSLRAFEYEIASNHKGELVPHFWNLKDIRKFIAQVIAKSKASQKPITNLQLILILAAIGLVVFLQLMIIKNTGGLRF